MKKFILLHTDDAHVLWSAAILSGYGNRLEVLNLGHSINPNAKFARIDVRSAGLILDALIGHGKPTVDLLVLPTVLQRVARALPLEILHSISGSQTPPQLNVEYGVYILGYPHERKIEVIKTIWAITNYGLKEAKELSEQPPPVAIVRYKDYGQARSVEKALRDVGAMVQLRIMQAE